MCVCVCVATDIDMSVVGAHVAHTAATLAMGGEYSQARLSALSSQRMLQRNRYIQRAIYCGAPLLGYEDTTLITVPCI